MGWTSSKVHSTHENDKKVGVAISMKGETNRRLLYNVVYYFLHIFCVCFVLLTTELLENSWDSDSEEITSDEEEEDAPGYSNNNNNN